MLDEWYWRLLSDEISSGVVAKGTSPGRIYPMSVSDIQRLPRDISETYSLVVGDEVFI